MATDVKRLVDAEQAVQDLLSELGALRAETEHYSSAAKSLLDTRQDLCDLCQRTSELAGAAHESVAAVKEIGTPVLLDRLDEVTECCQQTQTASSGANEAASATLGKVERLSETIGEQIRALGTVEQATSRLEETCNSQFERTRRQLTITTGLLYVTLVAVLFAVGLQVRELIGMP